MKVFALLALVFWADAARALTVRVDPAGGAPRIMVDGHPVRARMFWGGPGQALLPMAAGPRVVTFEFTAALTTSTGTMHFRFGREPGEIELDDIEVRDLGLKGERVAVILQEDFERPEAFKLGWRQWPEGASVAAVEVGAGEGREGSSGLKVKLTAPADGPWPDFHIYTVPKLPFVAGHRYQVSFWVRASGDRKLEVAFYQPGSPFVRIGGPETPWASQIQLAAEAGIHFVSFPIPLPWPEPGNAPDWTAVDAMCRSALQANPHALLLPRIGMDPPAWWCAAHPEEVMHWEDGGAHGNYAVPASPRYRRDAATQLTALVGHLEQAFGGQIAGYHPAGQNTGEWFYANSWERPLNGYAPADLEAWRRWLEAKRAPGESGAATVPTAAERHASPAGSFRDPEKEARLLEWAEFQQEMMAECVMELAHAVREATHGRKLVVFFYGYGFAFSGLPTGPAVSGHYALRQVLACPDIDVICAPISYFDRGLGGGAPSMSAAESVALAGKLWLNEDDTHTYLATGVMPGSADHVGTVEETLALLTRNVGEEAVRNFGTWWMDLGSSGWFNDRRLWERMAQLRGLDDYFLEHPTPFRPEIAAVIDEKSLLRVTEAGVPVSDRCVGGARAPLGRVGAPVGYYLLDDVLAGRVRAKLYVFLDAWALDASQRARLQSATREATTIWCYAPPGSPEELTGFHVATIPPEAAWATPTGVAEKLGLHTAFGRADKVAPLFSPSDATVGETLFTYPDGRPAVAMRRRHREGPAAIFVGAPGLTTELMRWAARAAGAHLFCEEDCNIFANGPYLVLHADHDGPVTLHLPDHRALRDVLTGAPTSPAMNLRRGETRIFRY